MCPAAHPSLISLCGLTVTLLRLAVWSLTLCYVVHHCSVWSHCYVWLSGHIATSGCLVAHLAFALVHHCSVWPHCLIAMFGCLVAHPVLSSPSLFCVVTLLRLAVWSLTLRYLVNHCSVWSHCYIWLSGRSPCAI